MKRTSSHRIWLVRHGQTSWNVQQRFCGHRDIPLSPTGQAQSRQLAERLQYESIATIYTSDLERACATAETIAQQRPRSVPVITSAAWRELNFGDWEGLTYSEIIAAFKGQLGFFTDPLQYAPPGGENLANLLERITVALPAIIPNDGKSTVIVSHGGPLRVLLCYVLAIPLENQWKLRLDPGSLSAIDLSSQPKETTYTATLALFNSHCSLSTAII